MKNSAKYIRAKIESVCEAINRRIFTMNYKQECEVRDYLEEIFEYSVCLLEYESDKLADMLGVNTNCIFDVLSDLNLIESK
jgi:hypothetical protein